MSKKNIHIVQLIDSLAVGGAEMMAVNIANALAEDSNYSSYLVATRKEGDLKLKISNKVNYLFLNKNSSLDLRALLRLKNFIQINNIDIIHAHSSSFFYGALVKILLPNTKLIWHDHYGESEKISQRPLGILRYFSKYFSTIISVNSILKDWAEKNLRCNNVKYVENFAVLELNDRQTKLYGDDGKRIISVAGYRPQKNHLNLLQAFKIVSEKHPDWSLHLVGKQYNDKYYQIINNYIIENQLDKKVFQYGVKSDVGYILSQADIGVLSSDSEGLPVSLLEYGLAGLAVVVTDVGECANVLENGKFGLMVPPNNSLAFSNALLVLIENEDKRTNFAKSNQENINKKYGQQNFMNQINLIYNKI